MVNFKGAHFELLPDRGDDAGTRRVHRLFYPQPLGPTSMHRVRKELSVPEPVGRGKLADGGEARQGQATVEVFVSCGG